MGAINDIKSGSSRLKSLVFRCGGGASEPLLADVDNALGELIEPGRGRCTVDPPVNGKVLCATHFHKT